RPAVVDWLRLRPGDLAADPDSHRLVPAIDFMINPVSAQPDLPKIAASVKLSPFHFHRRFAESFGITPKNLRVAAQIAFAQKLLTDPNVKLIDVARLAGFAHQSHFTSRFKQRTGMTPTRWRSLMTE
ncbi:MAG: helix-turn-helix transcriptional regulator, partial [Phycisphaerae bacterium]|nr:helix-turn-helix transcriptional regulator [Phycisphaerae bacterium]